jgi:hypothetical protein
MEVSPTICPGWPQTLLNLASQVARIIQVSHQYLAISVLLNIIDTVYTGKVLTLNIPKTWYIN